MILSRMQRQWHSKWKKYLLELTILLAKVNVTTLLSDVPLVLSQQISVMCSHLTILHRWHKWTIFKESTATEMLSP